MLHPLLTVDSKGHIDVFPVVKDYPATHPISLFSFDLNSGKIRGDHLDVNSLKLTPVWSSQLNFAPNEKFISVAGKPANRKYLIYEPAFIFLF